MKSPYAALLQRSLRRAGDAPLLLAILGGVTCLALFSSAAAQEWRSAGEPIKVGELPELAVFSRDGDELYVGNKKSCDISVVSIALHRTTATVDLRKWPKAMVVSQDGRRIYVLLEQGTPDGSFNERCPRDDPTTPDSLGIVDTATKMLATSVPLPGQRWDDLALAADGRLFITQTLKPGGGFPGGVYVFDTSKAELERAPVIEDPGCPTGIALSEERLYVNYQCYGPGGTLAHDAIGVYRSSPPYDRIAVIKDFPNVGGQLALSPDGSQLWAAGNDACARLDYPVDDCPTVPSAVVNVIRTSDLRVLKTYGFSIEDSNVRISFSPDGVAFVGWGIHLKEIPTSHLVELDDVRRLPMAAVGALAFSPDGSTAYVIVEDRGVVQVMTRAKPGQQGDYKKVSGLTTTWVFSELGVRGSVGRCAEKADNTRQANCFRAAPQDLAPEIWQRADDPSLRGCGYPPGGPKTLPSLTKSDSHAKLPQQVNSHSDVYRCAANAALGLALAGKIPSDQGIEWAMEFMALETNEHNIEWRAGFAEYKRLSEQAPATLRPDERKELSRLSSTYKDAEKNDSRAFNDITLRLHDPTKLRRSLGSSAVLLSVFSWDTHTYTLLTSKDGQTLQQDIYNGRPLDQKTVEGLGDALVSSLSDKDKIQVASPSEGRALYEALIGEGEVADKLKAVEAAHPSPKAVLVWAVEGKLRNVPMSALWFDSLSGRQLLAEHFSNVTLTTPSAAGSAKHVDWVALALGATHPAYGLEPLGGVDNELATLFSDPRTPTKDKIPAKVLLDEDFTSESFASNLQALEPTTNESQARLVFLATHFVLDSDAGEKGSFLLTGGKDERNDKQKLTLLDLSRSDRYPFANVNLVVFSACHTATLFGRSGSEVEGLAFHLDQRGNGAKSVLATLWEIDPDNSGVLMKTLDDGLRNGATIAEALRQAQVSMLLSHASPHYWAAYILMGDWR